LEVATCYGAPTLAIAVTEVVGHAVGHFYMQLI